MDHAGVETGGRFPARGLAPFVVRSRLLARLYRSLFVLPPRSMLVSILNQLKSRQRDIASTASVKPGVHPFDAMHGIDTGGVIEYTKLESHHPAHLFNADYGPSQPSIIRHAMGTIEDVEKSVFIDIGCGKGRALVVASEFPFREIIGIELVASLAESARINIERVARCHPERAPIRVVEGDATEMPLLDGQLVLFMYHPFHGRLMKRMVRKIEEFVARNSENTVYILYYNPICADMFDRSPFLMRQFAREIAFAPEELEHRNFQEDNSDLLAIWRSCRPGTADRKSSANARIRRRGTGYRAIVDDG